MCGGLTPGLSAPDAVREASFRELDLRLTRGLAAPVALGLSGGSDSMALLRLAADWCARARRPLLALTVDHGLSPHSATWTRFALDQARAVGARAQALPWTGPKPTAGLPAAARAARHGLLAQAARGAGARVVLLGHTADDVAEGERMRLADAPGLGRLRAWAPSPAWPQGRGVFLLRPLLGLTRARLRDWLRERDGTGWIEDPANADPRYARARARTSLQAGEAPSPADGIAAPTSLALAGEAQVDGWGRVAWRRGRLATASRQDVAHALALAGVCAGGGSAVPRSASALAVAAALQAGDAALTLAGARIAGTGGAVMLTRAAPRDGVRREAVVDGVWDGRFEVAADASGWTTARLAGHAARLPAADRRALSAIPADARPALPVLLDADGAPRLPRPLGDGPGAAACLVRARLRAACGGVRCEADLG